MKKKIVIIGGGIAGLSAGIYGLQNDFLVEIYEKHSICGGECTGWKRKDYLIDNCVHWLTGTRKETKLYEIWENLSVLSEHLNVLHADAFYTTELNGDSITLWRDLERTKKEMLSLSPEDEKEIAKLIHYIKLAETMEMPVDKPFDQMNVLEYIKLGTSMADMGKVMKEYGKITVEELAKRFKHPLLQHMITAYMAKEYLAYSFIVSYATFTSGNGGVPEGGSLDMIQRMKQRFEDLGGIVFTNSDVSKIEVEKNHATGITLVDGKFIGADYVIAACDTDYTFHQLLDESYMDKKLQKTYQQRQENPLMSGFQIAFSVDDEARELKDTIIFECEPMQIATQTINRMSIKNYRDYGKNIAPEGKTVLQSNFVQYEADYEYWTQLYNKKEEYNQVKQDIAQEVLKRLEVRSPNYVGKIHVIDVWTPATYHKYYNAYHGAYMSFITTKRSKYTSFSGNIKGLDNVFLASQWLMSPGGLPTAAVMGKFAIQRILKKS